MDKPLPTEIKTYDDAVQWIYGRINYEHTQPGPQSDHFRLDRMVRLLELIDSPQERIRAVHIAGTKGKGSTAAMVDSILRASGYRIGLFTSPHIRLFEERMRVNGDHPNESQLTEMVRQLASRLSIAVSNGTVDPPTYFEVSTILAWMYFDRQQVDLVVLETGLGGRLDCTNVCRPIVTAITSIGLDHTHILGDTLEQIAAEKAGIIKPKVLVLTSARQPEVIRVITNRARELDCECQILNEHFRLKGSKTLNGAPVISVEANGRAYESLSLSLRGSFQQSNATLAVAIADRMADDLPNITPESIREGLATTDWPLRLEVADLSPTVVLDAAHNPDAMAALIESLREMPELGGHRVLIFASSRDKDARGMLSQAMSWFDTIVLTQFMTNPRCTSVEELCEIAACLADQSESANATTIATAVNPVRALAVARRAVEEEGFICVAGSIFLSAEMRDFVMKDCVVRQP